jgi:flagellar basal body-associated protein FliL
MASQGTQRQFRVAHGGQRKGPPVMLTVLLIILLVVLLFGGFGYSRRGRGV